MESAAAKKAVPKAEGSVILVAAGAEAPKIGTLADRLKLVAANGKSTTTVSVSAGELPDLSKFQVKQQTQDELERQAIEARRRSDFVKEAVGILIASRARQCVLVLLEEEYGILPPHLEEELTMLRQQEQVLLRAGDEKLQGHLRFALLLEEVRTTPPTKIEVKALLERIVDTGRYRKASLQEAKVASAELKNGFVIFLDIHGYIPAHAEPEKTAGQRGLENELRKLVAKLREDPQFLVDGEIDRMLRSGANDNLFDLRDGDAGLYVLHLPERKAEKRFFPRGGGIVKVHDISGKGTVIEIIRGVGGLDRMNANRGKYIPLEVFRSRRIPDGTPEATEKFIRWFMGVLQAALAVYKEGAVR